MKRDVLLTGATGLIGGEIARELVKRGRRVWCVVRAGSFADAGKRLERRFKASGERCDWNRIIAIPGDVTKRQLGIGVQTQKHLRSECGYMIHSAADTSFAPSNKCESVNICAARNVVELSHELGSHVKLFHMSSAAVCTKSTSQPILEDTPFSGFCNDYVRSKRASEAIVLQSGVDSVILRPSIVFSQGIRDRNFARSILWVFPIIRSLGVLPTSGYELIDAVSVNYVAQSTVELLERDLPHRIYHISAGAERSVSWRKLFHTLTQSGQDYSNVRFERNLEWKFFSQGDAKARRLKEWIDYYLPFILAGSVYDCSRLRDCLSNSLPLCPELTEYCAELLDLFSERHAFAEAAKP